MDDNVEKVIQPHNNFKALEVEDDEISENSKCRQLVAWHLQWTN